MKNFFKNRRDMITGTCGTIGKEITRQLHEEYQALEVVGIDNNESELFFIAQKYGTYENATFPLAEVRDQNILIRVMQGIDIVFHTAALKTYGAV